MNGNHTKVSAVLEKVSETEAKAKIEVDGTGADIVEAWCRLGHEIAKQMKVSMSKLLFFASVFEKEFSKEVTAESVFVDLTKFMNGEKTND